MLCRKLPRELLTKTSAYLLNRNYVNIRQKIDNDLLLSTIEYTKIKSIEDWKNVRKVILEHEFNRGRYTKHNIDASIVTCCTNSKRFELGASYLNFLDEANIKPNLATIGKFLKLLYMQHHEDCLKNASPCPAKVEDLILKRYESLRNEYPVLDSFTLENAVLALSLTTRWIKCLDLLQEIKISATPNLSVYSAVVSAAFLNEEENLGWRLLEEMVDNDKPPRNITFLSYIKFISKIKKKDKALEKFDKLCTFLQSKAVICEQSVALSLDDISGQLGLRNNFTTVTYNGVCKCCNRKLANFELSDGDFTELKSKVLDNVIVGRDVFIKTNPEELERFKGFVAAMGEFDVVLDGLNVAYSSGIKQSPAVLSHLVASVVRYFTEQDLKVLVLGRQHMNRWPKDTWGYVTKHATVFLAQNISQDDPYLLYCALNSGKDTRIVTRDLMRSHRFLLRSARHRTLFNRWLSQHQYQLIRVDNRRGPIFRSPLPFSIVAQLTSGGTWHVPYEVAEKRDQSEYHKMWLCLKR